MHKRDQRNSNTFMDIKRDRSDHKPKVHRIPTNTQEKTVTSYGSLRDHCIGNQKREREESIQILNTNPQVYKELLMHHRRGTNEDDEPLCDGVQIAAAGIDFRRLPQGFQNIGVFIEQRGGAGGDRGGHNLPGRAQVSCAPLGAPLWYFLGPSCVFWSGKNLQKVSLRLDSVWY